MKCYIFLSTDKEKKKKKLIRDKMGIEDIEMRVKKGDKMGIEDVEMRVKKVRGSLK